MNGDGRKKVYFIARAKSTPDFDLPTLPDIKIVFGEEVEPEPPPKPLVLIIVVTRHTLTDEERAQLDRGLLEPEEESEVIEEEDVLEEEEEEPEEEEEAEEEEEEAEEREDIFGDTIDRYITLIESTYPEGMVVKLGVQPGDPEERWLTQSQFFSVVSSAESHLLHLIEYSPRYKNYCELHPEAYGYDQIHILGHGGGRVGLLFAREGGPESGWVVFTETEDMGNASDVFPLKPDGNSKIIIAACFGDKGQMRPWMRKSIEKDDRGRYRAFGVSEMWHVNYDTGADDPYKTPVGWKVQHPSMQAIARRLDII